MIKQINELNDRAITLTNEQREPVAALKCLKQAQDLYSQVTQPNSPTDSISYIDVVLSYNQAACYWNLKILEECADNLERAVE